MVARIYCMAGIFRSEEEAEWGQDGQDEGEKALENLEGKSELLGISNEE
jgi:hypothetical protein